MVPDLDVFAATEIDPDEHPTLRPDESCGDRGEAPERRTFGRFQAISRIGAGGMGAVYLAWDPRLDRRVAIKVLLGPGLGASHERLIREAKAMARLSHPNIVPIYEVDVEDEELFIVMEYVDGPTLREWLEQQPRSTREILRVFVAAGQGLAAAHATGIIHRDFKPDNVLIGKDGRPRVADFGVVRIADARTAALQSRDISRVSTIGEDITRSGALVGTPAYMSPEQFAAGEVTSASDLFSFCVALWEALYHQRPFAGDDLYSLVDSVTSGRLRPPPEEHSVPAALHAALERGLATDPRDRWPSFDSLLRALSAPAASADGRSLGLVGIVSAVAVVAVAALGVAAALVLRSTGGDRKPAPTKSNPPVARQVNAPSGASSTQTEMSSVTFELKPGDAVVKIDGRRIPGGSPRPSGPLAPGSHFVEVSREGFLPFDEQIELTPGTAIPVPVTLDPRRVTLKIEVEPPDATLALVEGEHIKQIEAYEGIYKLQRKPKVDYGIEGAKPGYLTGRVPISFNGESYQTVRLALVRDPNVPVEEPSAAADSATRMRASRKRQSVPEEAKTSLLKLGTGPGLPPATVWVDGEKQPKQTPVIAKVAPGTHLLKFEWPDGRSLSEKVSIGDHESKVIKGSP